MNDWVESVTYHGATITITPHGDGLLLRIDKGEDFTEWFRDCPLGMDLHAEAKELIATYYTEREVQ